MFSVFQRKTLTVLIDRAGQDHDAFDETPDLRNDCKRTAAEQSQKQLHDCFGCIAEIEVVSAEASQEDAEQACTDLRFVGHVLIILAGRILLEGVRLGISARLSECLIRIGRA